VSPDGATALFTAASGENNRDATIYALDVARGAVRVVWSGKNLGFLHGAAGCLVARDGEQLVIVRDGKEVARKDLPRAVDLSYLEIGSVLGGRVILAHCVEPHEVVAFGFYDGEPDPIREIGRVAYRWGGAFSAQEGRAFVVQWGRNMTVNELRGLADAWDTGRAGEVKKKQLAPGELGFRALRYGTYEAGAPVANLREIASHEHDPIVPCVDGGWVTAVRISRKHVRVVLADVTMAVRAVDLPPADYNHLRVSEDGTRALADGIEVALPALELHPLVTQEKAIDFAVDGRFIVGGTRLCERAPDGTLRELARIELKVFDFITAAGGRIIAADCRRQDGSAALALVGIYGDELRLVATPDRPPGVSLYWRRVGGHVMAHADDYLELLGAAETWERGKDQPALPLGTLERKPEAAAPAKLPAPTPRLDALVAELERKPRRAATPPVHARILAGTLPDDVRRLVKALAEHDDRVGIVGFEIDDDTLSDRAPGPDGERDDLVVIAEDGGGNLYAVDREDGKLLFLDHEERFADRSVGQTIEELLEEKAADGDDDDGDEPTGQARRLTSTEGGSSKFWEGAVEGTTLTVRFGKIGSAGQTKTKSFASADAARKELAKLIAEKLAKGYKE
jgi:predicted DNA-binding WGR domain protein